MFEIHIILLCGLLIADSLLNLDNLLIHIKRDATQVWYQLGDALGIKKAILDKFTTCSPEEAIIEMLDYWLRSHTGKPTWKEVADALRKIHLHESASGIETLSKTGKYHNLHISLCF